MYLHFSPFVRRWRHLLDDLLIRCRQQVANVEQRPQGVTDVEVVAPRLVDQVLRSRALRYSRRPRISASVSSAPALSRPLQLAQVDSAEEEALAPELPMVDLEQVGDRADTGAPQRAGPEEPPFYMFAVPVPGNPTGPVVIAHQPVGGAAAAAVARAFIVEQSLTAVPALQMILVDNLVRGFALRFAGERPIQGHLGVVE
jgi:hypothetical protein